MTAGPRPALTPSSGHSALGAMLEAKSVAIVGASERAGTFGRRVVDEIAKSPSRPEVHLVNPRYERLLDRPCVATLDDIADPVDLVLMCVPDSALETEMQKAAKRGDRSAVVFGSAWEDPADGIPSLRKRVAAMANEAGMAICGGGCMGFVNVAHGLRAIGYVEADPIPEGPLALVSCSGSAFSALLRTHRRFGWTLAVSSGQELVTPAAAYLDYAVGITETKVVALLLEQMNEPALLSDALERAAANDVVVVALTVGNSASGRAMVTAHSGALAGDDAAWEALFDAHGVIRVRDLDEMTDTLELFSVPRRPGTRTHGGGGIATVHDSGAERALVADIAEELSVPFAPISKETESRIAEWLDPGLEPGNPLDLWGTGSSTADRFGGALLALADDPEVDAVALCVDMVFEFDDDDSYELALYDTFEQTTKPVALLSNVHSAIDPAGSDRLREAGVPVLEGTRTGLLALRHLLEWRDYAARPRISPHAIDPARQKQWVDRLASGPLTGAESLLLVSDYDIGVTQSMTASDRAGAVRAAEQIGLPVVLKTDAPGIAHKSDVGGVIVGLDTLDAVARAYGDLADRLGPEVLVAAMATDGVELALGIVTDPGLGPIVVVGAGGILVELMGDRAVALPPVDIAGAHRMIDRLAVRRLLDGVRGAAPADIEAVARAVVCVSVLATELGDAIVALDINPLRCTASGVVALDALIVGA